MRVLGQVMEKESGRPLEGLLVRVYDEDLLRDDFLGETRTDAGGRFELSFTEAQFRDFHETLPDLYLRIFDASGSRLLHTTQDQVRRSAQVEERFEIRIARESLSAS